MEENTKRVVDLINKRVNQVQSLLNHSYKTLDRGSDEFIKLKLYQIYQVLNLNVDVVVDYQGESKIDRKTGDLVTKPNFYYDFDSLQRNIYGLCKNQTDESLPITSNLDKFNDTGMLIVDFQEGETNGSYALFCRPKHLRRNDSLHWSILRHLEKYEYALKGYKEVYKSDDSKTIGLVFRGDDQCSTASLQHVAYSGDVDETFDILLGRVDLGKLLFNPY